MSAESAKNLLIRYNQQRYTQFILSKDVELTLPAVSSVPLIDVTKRQDTFKKTVVACNKNKVNFISKNDEPYSFQWQTTPAQLKNAVRWGIVRTESITGKVISALGNYRVIAHERVLKGMISNTHALKIQFLDLFQQRFEALQSLESLVNKNNDLPDYTQAIQTYIENLVAIKTNLENQFAATDLKRIHPTMLDQLQKDIEKDIENAEAYLKDVRATSQRNSGNITAYNEAHGNESILEFVKNQMIQNLYQMQGMNQDFSYSKKREFALTRGSLNDCIEDAQKEISAHDADPRNAVRADHHGHYEIEKGYDSITYDFGLDNLTPSRQRQVLMGISFIEDADEIDCSNSQSPKVKNHLGEEALTVVIATNWQLYRNFKAFAINAAYFLLNALKGVFVETRPWEKETWVNKDFHLVANQLRQHAKPNEPLILKPVKLLKTIINSIKDCYGGIYHFGAKLTQMPVEIFSDWKASKPMGKREDVIAKAEKEILDIHNKENDSLKKLLSASSNNNILLSPAESTLAKTDYHLTAGEQNDILTAMVRGVDSFSSVFTTIFAKDPVGGVIFTAAYATGAAAIFYPAMSASLFGAGYVNWFANFSYSMGASKFAAAIAGGSTQAQVALVGWDAGIHGPNGIGATVATQLAEDPVTYASYSFLAYALGYVLVNGINGYEIPGLSEGLKGDLGTNPKLSYPVIGGKFGLLGSELFHHKPLEKLQPLKIEFNGKEVNEYSDSASYQKTIEQFQMAFWLSMNAESLPKLDYATRFEIERHIDVLFETDKANSLKKILHPEVEPSIGFQLFAIPLTYIPTTLRLLVACVISPVAWLKGNPYPLQPIKNAGNDLLEKVAKDLNRLLVAGTYLTYVGYNLLASVLKVLVLIGNMVVSRGAAMANMPVSHSTHQFFAQVHKKVRNFGEWLYPAKIAKHVVSANPAHTILEMERSYKTILDKLGITSAVQLPLSSEAMEPIEQELSSKDTQKIDINVGEKQEIDKFVEFSSI